MTASKMLKFVAAAMAVVAAVSCTSPRDSSRSNSRDDPRIGAASGTLQEWIGAVCPSGSATDEQNLQPHAYRDGVCIPASGLPLSNVLYSQFKSAGDMRYALSIVHPKYVALASPRGEDTVTAFYVMSAGNADELEPLKKFGFVAQSGAIFSSATQTAPTQPSTVRPSTTNPRPSRAPDPQDGGELQVNTFGYVAIETKSGLTRCVIEADYVGCETSERNWPQPGVKILADGTATWIEGNLGDIRPVTLDYRTYRALGWTVVATASGTRFTNDRTGHGAIVSAEKVSLF